MKLIIGLGNPEPRYDLTRHNVGFWVLNNLAESWGLKFKLDKKFKAEVATTESAGDKILLVKPQTFYNSVGESARAIMDFYKLTPADILVIHDDLNLPIGTIRTRIGGSHGGNNGLKSLDAHVGSETLRIRVGIWTDKHPTDDKVKTVLGKLSKDENTVITEQFQTTKTIVEQFITDNFTTTTYNLHL